MNYSLLDVDLSGSDQLKVQLLACSRALDNMTQSSSADEVCSVVMRLWMLKLFISLSTFKTFCCFWLKI